MPDKTFWRFKTYLDIGKRFMQDVWDEADLCRNLLECPAEKDKIKVRILKRIATIFTDKIFPRDPEIVAKPKRPMPGPVPIDPATGMPAVDPMTGNFMPPEDLSEKRSEVVELVMNNELKEIGIQGEIRAAIHDAFVYPASAIQDGYDFEEERKIDSVYARRRSIKDIILDPSVQMYFGQIHDCRFIGVRLRLTKEDCKKRGIDHTKIPESDQEDENNRLFLNSNPQRDSYPEGDDYNKDCVRYVVWQIWDIVKRDYAYISENAEENQSPSKPWPWQLKGFPIHILCMDRIPDKPFGHSIVWDMQDQQIEINDLRTTMHDQVVDAKPFTVYDPNLLSEDKISTIANRRKDLHVPVEGLAGRMIEQFFRKINPDGMTTQELEFYQFLKSEIFDVGGVSGNDRAETTNSTATEAAIVERTSAMMAGAKSATAIVFIRQVVRGVHEIIEQTYTTERITAITSPELGKLWVSWTGPQLLGDFNIDLDIITAEPNDPDTEKRKAVELLNIVAPIPGANPTNLGLDVLRAYGKKKPGRYLGPPPPMLPPGILPPQGGKK